MAFKPKLHPEKSKSFGIIAAITVGVVCKIFIIFLCIFLVSKSIKDYTPVRVGYSQNISYIEKTFNISEIHHTYWTYRPVQKDSSFLSPFVREGIIFLHQNEAEKLFASYTWNNSDIVIQDEILFELAELSHREWYSSVDYAAYFVPEGMTGYVRFHKQTAAIYFYVLGN